MADWWNSSYSLRRNIRFTPSTDLEIESGYPLNVSFNYNTLVNSNKVRPDFADLEVVYWNGTVNTVIPHQLTVIDENVFIQFNAVSAITATNNSYYIYMANSSLYNQPTVPAYVSSDFVIDTSATSGIGLSFTKPTEDWIEGLSTVAGAKATFSFFGINARLVVEKGPNRGILELILNNQEPVLIDCYNPVTTQEVVYVTSGLSLARHNIRMRVTGDKNSSSIDFHVKIIKFEYSKYVLGVDLGEELNTALSSRRIFIGP